MKRIISLLLVLVLVFCELSTVFAVEESFIDLDIWSEYFFYDTQKADNELPQRSETATQVYFGKKSDYLQDITGVEGVAISTSEDDRIKVYELGTVYYILSEDDGSIAFPEYSWDMFCGFRDLTNVTFGTNIDTSNALTMAYLFEACESLTELDLSNFVFNEEVYTYCIFEECCNLSAVTFPAGADMSLFTEEDPFSVTGMKFGGWYYEPTYQTKYTGAELESNTTLYPLLIEKASIELDLSKQNYVLSSADDLATFDILTPYDQLDGFEITYYFNWGEHEAESNYGVDFSGDFDVEIYRYEDEEYKEYSSGRIKDALHVSGGLFYDGKGITSGEEPTDNNIYEKGDEFVIQGPGTMVKKGFRFVGWIYGSDMLSSDSGFYYGGETVHYSGSTATAYWSLNYSAPEKENDYTLEVDPDAVDSIQWYRQNKGQYTLSGNDFINNEYIFLGIGQVENGVIKSDENWNEIFLRIESEILDIDDTATIHFNNLPDNYSCVVNGQEQEIVDNTLLVTAGWTGVYLDLEALDELDSPFEIISIDVNGTITEKLEKETNCRISDATSEGMYSVKMCYLDPVYNMDASVTLGFIDAVKVNFCNNNANGEIAPKYNLPGRSITLPGGDVFSAAGYRMIGWSTNPYGYDSFYPLNSEFVVRDEDITLYAIWEVVYGSPTYEWSEDYTSCTASCIQEANGPNTLTETAKASINTKDGFTIYEVSFTDSRFEKQTYKVKIEEKEDKKDNNPIDDNKKEDSGNSEIPNNKTDKNINIVWIVLVIVVVGGVLVAISINKRKR